MGLETLTTEGQTSFDEMSQQAALSPSPIHRFFGISNFSRFIDSPASTTNTSSSDRRRFSHPHNTLQQFGRASEDMAERPYSRPRPQLSHQASNTIDLTDDTDDDPVPSRFQERDRARRPPQLGRSDAQFIDNVIDLTDDSDVVITSSRQLPLPRPNVHRPPPPSGHIVPPALFVSPQHISGGWGFGNGPDAVMQQIRRELNQLEHIDLERFDNFHAFNNSQAMPVGLNYERGAFTILKPDYVPPPPAKQGFTRSPTSDDIVICPSCEEELVQMKDIEEPATKKGGKAPTKREREEHPFWVVRECGHVYCNYCFQNRLPTSKQPDKVSFPERSSGSGKTAKKLPFCSVEDCQSEVKSKDKWVGIFL